MGVFIRSFFCLLQLLFRMSIKAVSVLALFVSVVSGNYYLGHPLHYPVHYPAVSYAPAQHPDLTYDNAATAWESLGAAHMRNAYSAVSGYYPTYPLHYPAVSYAPAQYPDLTFDNAATAWKSLGAGHVRHAYSTPSYQASYLSGYAPATAYAPGYMPYTVNGQVLYYPAHALRQEYSSTYAAPSYVPAYPSYTPAYPSHVPGYASPDNYAYGYPTGYLYSHGAAYGAQGQVSYR